MTTLINLLETNNRRLLKSKTLFMVIALTLMAVILAGAAILILQPVTATAVMANNLLGSGGKTPWHLSRAAGTVGYLLLAGSTVWGLLLSSKIVKETIPAALSLAMHNILSWLALVFAGLHALVLLLDNYYSYSLLNLTVPFTGPYRPLWVGLGIISFYLLAVVILSFQFRTRLGQQRWRTLHYLSFAAFIMVTVHGIAAGTDSNKMGMQVVYLASGLLVFFLINYRFLTAGARRLSRQARER